MSAVELVLAFEYRTVFWDFSWRLCSPSVSGFRTSTRKSGEEKHRSAPAHPWAPATHTGAVLTTPHPDNPMRRPIPMSRDRNGNYSTHFVSRGPAAHAQARSLPLVFRE